MDALIGSVLGLLIMQVGRLAVWLFSLGRWRGEKPLEDEGLAFGAAGALSFVRNGQRVITETGLLFAGITVLIALVIVALIL
jgi:hypothetical protein